MGMSDEPKKNGEGCYRIGGVVVKTARRLQREIPPGEGAVDNRPARRKTAIFHGIRPKYCRMLGINPEDMVASLEAEVRVGRLDRQIDAAFEGLPIGLPLPDRIWKAHFIGMQGNNRAVLRFIARRILKMPVPKWRVGEYPPSPGEIKLLADPARRDAMDWLESAGARVVRSFGRGRSNADSRKFVAEIKAVGAPCVIVGAESVADEEEWVNAFLVELPTARAQRARFIAWAGRLRRDEFVVPIKEDIGERYVYSLALDVQPTPVVNAPAPMTPERLEDARLLSERITRKLQSNPEKEELLSWLAAGTRSAPRTLGELRSAADSLKLAREIYQAGAKEIWAVEIQKAPDFQNTGRLVVVLPEAGDRRAAVFEVINKLVVKLGFYPTPDFGQAHTLLILD